MDPLTVTLQQARAAAFNNLTQQTVSQFANIVDDKDDEDRWKRGKSVLHQRLHWARFVVKNKHWPFLLCMPPSPPPSRASPSPI
jgi:hypothetical protein